MVVGWVFCVFAFVLRFPLTTSISVYFPHFDEPSSFPLLYVLLDKFTSAPPQNSGSRGVGLFSSPFMATQQIEQLIEDWSRKEIYWVVRTSDMFSPMP